MARQILGLEQGDPRQADHINHDTLDNRRFNLRIVTQLENKRNRASHKGYSWNKHAKKYEAYIKINDKQIYLGYFDNPNDARVAYLSAKKVHLTISKGAVCTTSL